MGTEENKAIDEAIIRRLIDGWAKAFRAKDIDGVMSNYAQDIVSFDLVPPLRYAGIDEYRKPWEETFPSFEGPIDYEVRDLHIATGDDVAFSHSLNRMSGTMKDEQKIDLWVRWTACFRKIDGKWLITHEQVSVPVDLESGKAVLDLKP
jgi:uncharacterized protein (TIGR02246 family)